MILGVFIDKVKKKNYAINRGEIFCFSLLTLLETLMSCVDEIESSSSLVSLSPFYLIYFTKYHREIIFYVREAAMIFLDQHRRVDRKRKKKTFNLSTNLLMSF